MAKLTIPVGEQDHAQGSADAPITLVEYGDYQCPTCGQAYPIVRRVQKHFGDKLRFAHRNFPLPQHDFADPRRRRPNLQPNRASSGRCTTRSTKTSAQ